MVFGSFQSIIVNFIFLCSVYFVNFSVFIVGQPKLMLQTLILKMFNSGICEL